MSGKTPTVGEGDFVASPGLSVLAASILIIVLRDGDRREPIRSPFERCRGETQKAGAGARDVKFAPIGRSAEGTTLPHGLMHESNDAVYSNRIMGTYLAFLDQRLGRQGTDALLKRAGTDRIKLSDLNGFATQAENDAFMFEAIRATGEPDMAYIAGREYPKHMGRLVGFIAGVTSPQFFMRSFGQIEERLALKTINRTERIGHNKFKVDITFRDGFKERAIRLPQSDRDVRELAVILRSAYAHVEHPVVRLPRR